MSRTVVLTLALIMLVIALLAVSAPYAGPTLASVFFSVAYATTLTATITAIIGLGPRRAYWRGFALFGMFYFVCTWVLADSWWLTSHLGDAESRVGRPTLVTSRAIAWVYDLCSGNEFWTTGGSRANAVFLVGKKRELIPRSMDITALEAFLDAGHATITVLLGLLGGLAGSWISRSSERGAFARVETITGEV